MCGFAGKIIWNNRVNAAVVANMCERLKHRGPDDSGIVSLDHITVGHRRLAILDLSEKARQPMATQDGRYIIVYNGEVYNFKEVRSELENLGEVFISNSDTEVVLKAYALWGPGCLSKFDGMFAIAIWDAYKKGLFLARDRFGKKPLYYYKDHKSIVFASELTALLLDTDVPKRICYEALNCYLSIGYILNPLTIYEQVFKLEPATYMTISYEGSKIEKVNYWDYSEAFHTKIHERECEVSERILELLDRAVKKRMIADVPVGSFLSGGIDSSSIAALMKRYCNDVLHTFSIGFTEKSYNELPGAAYAASYLGTTHHEKIVPVDAIHETMNVAIDMYDEPFADNSLVPTAVLAQLASSYVKVALSGDGADEIFAGYITYKADRYYYPARIIPSIIRKSLILMADNVPFYRHKKIDWRYKQRRFFQGTFFSPERAHYLWRIMFHPEEVVAILGEQYRTLVYDTDPFLIFQKYYDRVKGLHYLDRNLYVDVMTWLTDDILVKVDRATMHSGLETRCPYLDTSLVSYAASIPPHLKMKGGRLKYILKKALKDILPPLILKKPKSGFNAPICSWIGSDQKDEFKAFNAYVFQRKVMLCNN